MDYSLTRLSHEVAALLKAAPSESNRFRSMDLCSEIMSVADVTSDFCMLETLQSWIGKLQKLHG